MSYTYKNVLTRASITLQIIEDVAIYKAELYSTAGNIFQPTDKETDISVKVYKGLVDITNTFTDIVWRRFTFNSNDVIEDLEWGQKFNGQETITVTRQDINEKAKIQCEIYDVFKGERTLVAIESITIVDVNDLQPSQNPPQNPSHGQLWLDSSVDPPEIKMWDNVKKQWITISSTDPQVRNLIRNSNFFTKNFNLWEKRNTPDSMTIEHYVGGLWAHFKQETGSMTSKGISQIIKNVKQKSTYTIQVKALKASIFPTYTGGLTIAVYSIDENEQRTLIKEDTAILTETANIYSMKITSLDSSKNLEVEFSGEKNKPFDFLFTEAMIANTSILTPWELAPEDIMDAINGILNHEDIFNALTDNGKIQGIFTQKDNEGNTNFYLNASYIKTGTLVGELIDARNLLVKRDSDDLETLKIDSKGNVSINATSLSIRGDNVATEEDIAYKIEIVSTNGIVFTNGQISTTLQAKVFKGKDEVTDSLPASKFKWTRTSLEEQEDDLWNTTYGQGVKEVVITKNDVYKRATFSCEISK